MKSPLARLKLLGGFALEVAGAPTAVEARKSRGLIAVVALSPGQTASRERLMSLLWSDRGEDQARASLRQSLAVLRKELDNEANGILVIREEDVRFAPGVWEVDCERFLAQARSPSADELRAAASLYGGDVLEGVSINDAAFEEWLRVEQSRFRREAATMLDRLVAAETGQAKLTAAHRLVELDPLREASHRQLMEAYASLGESGLALKQFEDCKALLRDALQIDPSSETLALRDRIVKGGVVTSAAESKPAISSLSLSGDRPAVAVLPFANMSGDPAQDYFSDGITDDIITELSRFKAMTVIARNTSFSYRGRMIGVQVIGRELGVGYVLEGSVRRAGSRVRITAQLSDVNSGSQVWGERYDRELTDIFELQEDIARSIAGSLAIGVDQHELGKSRDRRLDDARAYEHLLRGKQILWKEGEGTLEGRRHFEAAIAVDPTLARAHAGRAVTFIQEALQFPPRARFEEALQSAHESALSALSLDPSECFGHMSLAWYYLYRWDHDRMKKHVDLALKLNPNDADTLANCVYLLMANGDHDEALRIGLVANALNPHHPEWYDSFISSTLFYLRRFEDSMVYRQHATDTFYDSVFLGAATLAHLGRMDEARAWADRAMRRLTRRLGEEVIAERGAVSLLIENNPFRRHEDSELFAAGMRLAGVPG